MTMFDNNTVETVMPLTTALRQAISSTRDQRITNDFLFLELWERCPTPGPATALRITQIRRANPELAAAIRDEIGHTANSAPDRRR
jgi:hypothetical protein